jgi:hypothetical protein
MVVEVCLPWVNRRENAVSRRVRDAIPLSFAHATISEGGYRLQARLTSTVNRKLIANLLQVWVVCHGEYESYLCRESACY